MHSKTHLGASASHERDANAPKHYWRPQRQHHIS